MSHIRLIISDIDGTILNDHHQIDPQLAALIPDLKRETIPFVLASARSPKGRAGSFRASFGQDGSPELYRLGQPTLPSSFDQPL